MPDTLRHPPTDPTPLFELFRGNHATELLTAAVAHFNLFEHLAPGPMLHDTLRTHLALSDRAAVVLFTALRAMNLLAASHNQLHLTDLSRNHLLPASPFNICGYIRLAADAPGVIEMVERLRTSRPAGETSDKGAAFIYRDGIESAMEAEASARFLTLALAGRAKNVAPALADRLDASTSRYLVDVAGGTGLYAIALLQKNPHLRAAVLDRPEVLKVAAEMAHQYNVTDRLDLIPADMFTDPIPAGADLILLSNVLHDWDLPECQKLVDHCAAALPKSGRLVIHDVFLHDDHSGPLPIALYSASLFRLTEGRAYSAVEYRQMLTRANLSAQGPTPTLVHCGFITGTK